MIEYKKIDLSSIPFNEGSKIVDSIIIESILYVFIESAKTLDEAGKLIIYKQEGTNFTNILEFEYDEDITINKMIVNQDKTLFIFDSLSLKASSNTLIKPLFIIKRNNDEFTRKIFTYDTKCISSINYFNKDYSKIVSLIEVPKENPEDGLEYKLVVYTNSEDNITEKFVWKHATKQFGKNIKPFYFIDNNSFIYTTNDDIKKISIEDSNCQFEDVNRQFTIDNNTIGIIDSIVDNKVLLNNRLIVFNNEYKKIYEKELSYSRLFKSGHYLIGLTIDGVIAKISVLGINDHFIEDKDYFNIDIPTGSDNNKLFKLLDDNKTIVFSYDNRPYIIQVNSVIETLFPMNNDPKPEDPENPNYNYEKITGMVTIKGANKTILVSRTKKVYTLTFNTTPTDCTVEILVKNKILTGKKQALFPGEYSYTISKNGYISKVGTVTITNQNVLIEETLENETIPPPQSNEKHDFILILNGKSYVDEYNLLWIVEIFYENEWKKLKNFKKVNNDKNNYFKRYYLDIYKYSPESLSIFGIEDILEGSYKVRIKANPSYHKEGFSFEDKEYTVNINKSNPNYRDNVSGLSNGLYYNLSNFIYEVLDYSMTGVDITFNTINSNIDDIIIETGMVYNDNGNEIIHLISSDLSICFREKLRKIKKFNTNKKYLLNFRDVKNTNKLPITTRIDVDSDPKTVELDFRDSKFKFDLKNKTLSSLTLLGISKNNKIIYGKYKDNDRDPDNKKEDFVWFLLKNNIYEIQSHTLNLGINTTGEYDYLKIITNGTRDYIFIYDMKNITIVKLLDSSLQIVSKTQLTEDSNRIFYHNKNILGNIVLMITGRYNDDHTRQYKYVYIFKLVNGQFKLYTKLEYQNEEEYDTMSISYDGKIISRRKNICFVDNNTTFVKASSNYDFNREKDVYLSSNMCIVKDHKGTYYEIYAMPYTLSGTNLNINESEKVIIKDYCEYNDLNTRYDLPFIDINQNSILFIEKRVPILITSSSGTINFKKYYPSNITSEQKSLLDTGDYNSTIFNYKNIYDFDISSNNRIILNKYNSGSESTAFYAGHVLAISKINTNNYFMITNNELYEAINTVISISYDGKYIISYNAIYEFIDDETIKIVGEIYP